MSLTERDKRRSHNEAKARPIKVVLFDLVTYGHHIEYGGNVHKQLNELENVEADFLTTELTSRHEEHFVSQKLREIPDFKVKITEEDKGIFSGRWDDIPESDMENWDERILTKYQRKGVKEAVEFLSDSEYDIVHFLDIDDLMEYLYHYVRDKTSLPKVVATLNGGRFFKNSRRNRVMSAISKDPTGKPIMKRAHKVFFGNERRSRITKGASFKLIEPLLNSVANSPLSDYTFSTIKLGDLGRNDYNDFLYSAIQFAALNNLVDERVFDHLLVHTTGAKSYVHSLSPQYAERSVTVVPDPKEIWFDDPMSKDEARRQLGLPTEGAVLLFFGELRDEKGIELLLNALEVYEGPPFTMVLAGSPADITNERIEQVDAHSVPSIDARLSFIPQEDISSYFIATDGVVLPYKSNWGYYRTSGPFQQAIATLRPVIAPDFGMFQQRIREWHLGRTFKPGSAPDLSRQLAAFVGGSTNFNSESAKEYARSQTYEELAKQLEQVYEQVLD